MHDLLHAYKFEIVKRQISGPVNFCAPQPIRNRELATKLGDALNRPAFMPAPAFMIKLLSPLYSRVKKKTCCKNPLMCMTTSILAAVRQAGAYTRIPPDPNTKKAVLQRRPEYRKVRRAKDQVKGMISILLPPPLVPPAHAQGGSSTREGNIIFSLGLC